MRNVLKKILPKPLKLMLVNCCNYVYSALYYLRNNGNKQAVYLVMTPEHANMGDHAIAKAELELFSSLNVTEITINKLGALLTSKYFAKKIFADNPVLCSGGGFLGTLWFNYESAVRRLIECTEGKVFILPNTCYYDDSEFGITEKEKSLEYYNQDRVFVFAREKASYELMKPMYKNVFLAPDMVFYLNASVPAEKRYGVQVTLRSDREKTVTNDYCTSLIHLINKHYNGIHNLDMINPQNIKAGERNAVLEEYFKKYRQSELVITDRLHGMIFSYITCTPCIVLNSKSHKLKGVYDWLLKDCEYITFTNDFDEISEFINKVKGKTFEYDNSAILPLYDELKSIIIREINL